MVRKIQSKGENIMRLWHKELIHVLPRQQLIAQLRECVLIAKNIKEIGKPNHILVNKIMDYDIEDFVSYIQIVLYEFKQRGYKVKKSTMEKLESYTGYPFEQWYNMNICLTIDTSDLFKGWHDSLYMKICYYNLYEKYINNGLTTYEWSEIVLCAEKYLRNKGDKL